MKDYETLIPTATAESVRWLVWEAADNQEVGFSDFRRIVKAAERRLADLERVKNVSSGDHPAVSDSARSVRAASDIKKRKGWPDCVKCELYTFTGECSVKDKSGLSPCEVMSRKMYKYLRRET